MKIVERLKGINGIRVFPFLQYLIFSVKMVGFFECFQQHFSWANNCLPNLRSIFFLCVCVYLYLLSFSSYGIFIIHWLQSLSYTNTRATIHSGQSISMKLWPIHFVIIIYNALLCFGCLFETLCIENWNWIATKP